MFDKIPIDQMVANAILNLDGMRNRRPHPTPAPAAHSLRESQDRQVAGFLTNAFSLPPTTICDPHKLRWQVELFFK